MKTRRAPGCNRRRQGDTDEWLKVCSLQSKGEGGLSGYEGLLCVCTFGYYLVGTKKVFFLLSEDILAGPHFFSGVLGAF